MNEMVTDATNQREAFSRYVLRPLHHKSLLVRFVEADLSKGRLAFYRQMAIGNTKRRRQVATEHGYLITFACQRQVAQEHCRPCRSRGCDCQLSPPVVTLDGQVGGQTPNLEPHHFGICSDRHATGRKCREIRRQHSSRLLCDLDCNGTGRPMETLTSRLSLYNSDHAPCSTCHSAQER